MSALSIQPTYPIFTDIDGQPLEAGYVWIGQANLDPQVNPINVYWDAALTILAPQPIRTLAGYPSNNGTPARLYVNSDYSIRVMNKNGSVVYSAPVATERYSASLIGFTGFNGQAGTVQDLADADGSDWIGFQQSGGGSVARSAQSKMRDVVSVKDFGAVGDGVTDDTAAIQAALDTGNTVYFPRATVGYKVSTIRPLRKQTLIGDGRWANGLIGDGTGPVIECGNGTGFPREHSIYGLSIQNTGERCIYANSAPNFHLEDCRLQCSGADALDLYLAYRATIRDCFITTSGAFTAVNALNNVNGLIIDGNTISGGSAGRAIRIGQSQGVRVSNNIIESSLNGIWIASTSDVGDGNCNGIHVTNNYIEQSSTPFVLGKVFTCLGLVCTGNYVGNSGTSVIPTRTAVIQHGRLRGAQITDNSFYIVTGVEDLVWIFLEVATCDLEGILYERNYVNGTPANQYQKFGTYATNGGVNNELGRDNHYDFGWLNELPTKRQFVSPWLSANVNQTLRWFSAPDGDAQFGGHIDSVQIIDATGTLGCNVAIGDNTNFQNNVASVDISTLTYAQGTADMVVASSGLRATDSGGYNQYRVVAGAGTGQFRIRITFRAN